MPSQPGVGHWINSLLSFRLAPVGLVENMEEGLPAARAEAALAAAAAAASLKYQNEMVEKILLLLKLNSVSLHCSEMPFVDQFTTIFLSFIYYTKMG